MIDGYIRYVCFIGRGLNSLKKNESRLSAKVFYVLKATEVPNPNLLKLSRRLIKPIIDGSMSGKYLDYRRSIRREH